MYFATEGNFRRVCEQVISSGGIGKLVIRGWIIFEGSKTRFHRRAACAWSIRELPMFENHFRVNFAV